MISTEDPAEMVPAPLLTLLHLALTPRTQEPPAGVVGVQ